MAFGVKKSFFGRMKEKVEDVIFMRPSIDEDMIDELEEALITSDIGMDTTMKITEQLRSDIKQQRLSKPEDVKDQIKSIVEGLIDKGEDQKLCDKTPLIILMIGVNGVGKTTSIAKITHRLQAEGKTVLLAAADTFRAAAAEQLQVWGQRLGVGVIRHQEGADPSAVIFDGIQAAKARGVDVLICDTAGRLHNKKNLMTELEKMRKVIDREWPEAGGQPRCRSGWWVPSPSPNRKFALCMAAHACGNFAHLPGQASCRRAEQHLPRHQFALANRAR